MKKKEIDLERTLYNQHQDLLLQQLFTASHVPESLVGVVRSFQKACIAQGIEDKLHFKESLVKRCEIQIGTLHLDLTTLDEEKVKKYLEANEKAEEVVRGDGQASGQIAWQFTGVNQCGAVMIRVKERSWQVEFSRLQRRISAFITDEAALRPKAHQALYEEMKKTLQPLASSEPSQLLILQGAPGLGKSHCTEHYFYHEANKYHQMVAWLSGESKESFLRDWEALANQLRYIDAKRKNDSDTVIIHHWCEEQLGQWLFIVDDLQVELDWLKQYLPQKGGHVLITTAQPSYSLSQAAKILSFSPLSSEDSVLLLKAWLGKYWEASGYTKEAQALSYFSEALGGSPALLTQIALLVRKKGLSFERVMNQFQSSETRSLLLTDTVFDQLKGQTFLECVKKSWRQWVMTLVNYYPQFTHQQHEEHLKQFIEFLKQEVAQELEKIPQVYVDEKLVIDHWQGVWASLSCAPLDAEQITTYLNLLPFFYDKMHQRWAVSLAGLHALECQGSAKDLSPLPALPEVTAVSPLLKEDPDLPQVPSDVNLSIGLENSALGYAEIALLTTDKFVEFTTWRLPTTNPYFIPRHTLTEEIAEKLPHKTICEKSAELVLAAASGMGGIGKTELARHFITTPELSSHYKKRLWFNAESACALKNEFHDFASYLGLIEHKEYVEDKALIHRLHGWFNLNPGWLMILDNADEYNSIAQWIPKEGGSVLITTREPNPGTLKDGQIVKVPLLTAEEAISWLYHLAQRDLASATEIEQKAARELVDNLGCLPLAIAQAAAYLREQKAVSIEAYQQNFLALLLQDESLIEREKPIDKKTDAYSRRVIANTWKLSLEMIEMYLKEKGLFNACPWLLAACSYLAPKDIPLGLLEYWFKGFFNLKQISVSSLSYLLDEYIAQLLRYSLCERAELTHMISIHRLVQEVLCSSLTREPSLLTEQEKLPAKIIYWDEKTTQKCVVKERVFPSISIALADYSEEFTPAIEDRKRRIDLISHLQMLIAAWETLNRQGEINPVILILLYARLTAVQLELRADAKEGLMIGQKQLALCEKIYGPKHLVVAKTLVNLSNAYCDLGDAQQQKSLLERALHIEEQHYGPEHPKVAITLTNLGNAYDALGDAQQEKNLLERVLRIFEKHYGLKHPRVGAALMNLGNAYGALGNAQQKKSLLERALRIREDHYGPMHPEVAETLANLGNAYGALGDAMQEKILLERALPILEQHYGLEHPHVAKTLASLGNVYGVLMDAQQQKSLLERALHIEEQFYRPEHLEVAKTLADLGNAYGALGDTQQQKSHLERALPIFEQHYGLEHPYVASILVRLSDAYRDLGDAQQEKKLLERVRHIDEHLSSSTSFNPVSYKQTGDSLLSYQQPLEAISYYEKALEIDPQFPGIHHNLACCYHIQGEIDKADACFQMGIALFSTPSILTEYAHFLIKQKRFQGSPLEKCLKAVTNGRLSYGMAEYPTVLPAIQGLIDKSPSHSIELSAQGLAYYLQVLYYQMCQQKKSTQEAMEHFELWIAQQSDLQQQETFQSLKSSLIFEAESIPLNLLPFEKQLFPAAVAGDLNVVQAIIEKEDFSIDWQERCSQRTALHLACISQQREVIAYLLSKLARFDIKDKEEKLAWEYVIDLPLLELFKTTSASFTQKYSASVNAGIFVDWGKVLRMAVVNNYLADVRFLIEVKGIDINSVDANPKTCYTALHLAVIRNKPEIASYLISKGANINALDANKKTPSCYIKPEQEELLALFHLSVSDTPTEKERLNFEKLSL